jgi:exonuclease SbcC
MIPIRLRLKNFLSYREPAEPLDFRSFQVACLCGENGHGKSTLLDAITWALWGRSRAKTEDELIHHGQTNMEVEFEFLLGDAQYRVIRKRRRGGPSALELQLFTGDRFQSLTGNSMHETERAIVQLLHLDYDTFVNSSFLLQGKADSFTISPPSKRKELLGEILGLGDYDQFEQRAKAAASAKKDALLALDARIAEIDRELAKEPSYRACLDQFTAEAARLSEEVHRLDESFQHHQHLRQQLDFAQKQVSRLEREIAERRSHHEQLERRLVELRGLVERAEAVLGQRETIDAGYASYVAAQQVIDQQSQKAATLTQLQQQRQQLEAEIQRQKARLELQRAQLAGRIEQLSAQGSDPATFEEAIVALAARVEEAKAQQIALNERKRRLQRLAGEIGQSTAEQKQLRQEMEQLKARIDALREMARCETCGQPITAAARDEQVRRLEAEGKQLGDRFRSLKRRVEELAAQLETENRALAREEAEVQAVLDADVRRLAQLREHQLAAANAAKELERLRPRLGALDATLAARAYAEHDQAALAELEGRIQALAYDPAALQAARERAASLQSFVELKSELDRADAHIDRWRTDTVELESEITTAKHRIRQLEADLIECRRHAAGLDQLDQTIHELKRTLAERRFEGQQAELQRAKYAQLVASCEALRTQRATYERERAEAAREQGIYEELARAFGKGGVQAMIIESVLPEIEEDANALLARMSDGRMRLALATRRETKQGKTVETLLIQVSDELGLRNYELFSGGEAFRVNFALRIALAKLLARRAGARLETLVIDEGFGTQDATGRDRLVEAIRCIEQDFAKIVVVTHIEELKDAFPVRIEVTKGPDGSRFALSVR